MKMKTKKKINKNVNLAMDKNQNEIVWFSVNVNIELIEKVSENNDIYLARNEVKVNGQWSQCYFYSIKFIDSIDKR